MSYSLHICICSRLYLTLNWSNRGFKGIREWSWLFQHKQSSQSPQRANSTLWKILILYSRTQYYSENIYSENLRVKKSTIFTASMWAHENESFSCEKRSTKVEYDLLVIILFWRGLNDGSYIVLVSFGFSPTISWRTRLFIAVVLPRSPP